MPRPQVGHRRSLEIAERLVRVLANLEVDLRHRIEPDEPVRVDQQGESTP